MPISGSDAFAVSGDRALFRGDYEDRDTYHLFSLEKNGKVKAIAKFQLINEKGEKLIANYAIGRGSFLYLLCDLLIYRVNLWML
jgi:1,4-dihydroxy-2-naphthoyl-CoA synthase